MGEDVEKMGEGWCDVEREKEGVKEKAETKSGERKVDRGGKEE